MNKLIMYEIVLLLFLNMTLNIWAWNELESHYTYQLQPLVCSFAKINELMYAYAHTMYNRHWWKTVVA